MPTAHGMEPKATTQDPLSITPTLALATTITQCLTLSHSHKIQHLLTIQVNLTRIHLWCLFCKYYTHPYLLGSVLFSERKVTHLIVSDTEQCKALLKAL
jgi:hypothetical protein